MFFFFCSCFYHISGTDETRIEANTPSEGECTDMKENILSEPTAGVGGEGIRDEWHPDRGGYLKAHLDWNQNFKQSQLKCGLSLKMGRQRIERYGCGKWDSGEDGKKKIPPPPTSLPAMLVEQMCAKWTAAAIFNYILKPDPLTKSC